jgi:hypothetical protein
MAAATGQTLKTITVDTKTAKELMQQASVAKGADRSAKVIQDNIEDLLKKSKCSSVELYKYLEIIDIKLAEEYLKVGKWPVEIQIPKSSEVLNSDGSIKWSEVPNGGYTLDEKGNAIKEKYILKEGDVIDRYGPPNGRYTSPVIENKPFNYEQRSLPYIEDPSKYHQYKVKDGFIDFKTSIETCTDPKTKIKIDAYMKKYRITYDDLNVQAGEIASGFGSAGGGIQYELPLPVNMLEDLNIIEKIK